MYAEVAVNLPPVRGTFHYEIPDHLQAQLKPGHLVTAHFGRRRVQGIVVALDEHAPVPDTRPLEALVDPQPVLTQAQLQLAAWLQTETRTNLIDCLTIMIPPGLSKQADSVYQLLDPSAKGQTPTQNRLLELLRRRGALRGRQIERAMGKVRWHSAAEALLRHNVLARISVLDPPTVRAKYVRTVRLAMTPENARHAASELGRPATAAHARRMAVVEALIAEGEPLEATWVYAESGGCLADLRVLEEKEIIALSESEVWRDPLEQLEFVPTQALALTGDQQRAWDMIRKQILAPDLEQRKGFLLHGVTGSGKTEIYLHAVEESLRLGRGAIILVPEIALTAQTVRRFVARFPGQVGLIHSQLSPGERYDTWRRCRSGDLKIVVGPRSALFTPMPEIGLIVLDESHDESYKAFAQAPRYHARETAQAYAQILHATCILGTATPDVVSMYHSQQHALEYISLPKRILGHHKRLQDQASRLSVQSAYQPAEGEADAIALPPVRVVDMRQELKAGNTSLFSRALQQRLTGCLAAGEQAILFLNRRGSSKYVFCRDCGHVMRCPRCDTPLTYHGAQEKLHCHHCGYQRNEPQRCPACSSLRIKYFGAGTQRIEAEVSQLVPSARILRWDWDSTRRKGAHAVILSHFAAHRADVLIGTQMIAKGLDLPMVTLVGVISADTGLNLPDYRASERTFQVLTQVAGRAGRGLLGGQVILQTYQPDHYAIQAAAEHDYQSFYQQELSYRRQLGYPPFKRLARLIYRHTNPDQAEREARRMAAFLQSHIEHQGAMLIGPVPCFRRKLGGEYRWQIVLRGENPVHTVPEALPDGWILDIDPVTLL